MSSKADFAAKRTFYENRKKELIAQKTLVATQHVYDEEGNLVTKNKDGSVESVITLPTYVSPSLEDKAAMEEARKQEIEAASKMYDEAFDALHREYQRLDRSDSNILQYTQLVIQADHQLQYARYPLRFVQKEDQVEIRKVDFHQPSEKRKLPYPIARLEVSPFALQDIYVRKGPASSVKAIGSSLASSNEPMVFIQNSDTNEYGFMALDWAVQLTVGGTTYHCAKQALVAERAKAMGDKALYQQAMEARTPAEVPSHDAQDEKQAEPSVEWVNLTKQLLYDINEIKFRTYPELQTRLFETKKAILAAYLPNDLLLGIGLPIGDLRAKSPVHWTGQNLLGTVLMEIRKKLREEGEQKEAGKKKVRPRLVKKAEPISHVPASLPPAAAPPASLAPASSAPLPPAPLVKKRPVLIPRPAASQPSPSS
jgi:ribA/ribD-fused uncharacterized protein